MKVITKPCPHCGLEQKVVVGKRVYVPNLDYEPEMLHVTLPDDCKTPNRCMREIVFYAELPDSVLKHHKALKHRDPDTHSQWGEK